MPAFPPLSERWPSANPRLAGLHVWRIEGFEKHLIFYRAADNDIENIRIIHAVRDIDKVLESGHMD
jgi:toxin ParE1/3/4